MDEAIDCAVIGGGPAGLSAATYLARYHRRVTVFDRGGSRAGLIPLSHNIGGWPDGISGADLLARMRRHALRYGATLIEASVDSVTRCGDDWAVRVADSEIAARTVLFATGVDNLYPQVIDQTEHDRALARGQLRYCPVCDGYEAGGGIERNARIGVIGATSHGVAEALFLSNFSDRVTLFTREECELLERDRENLVAAGVGWDPRPVRRIGFEARQVTLEFDDGGSARVSTIYPALGSRPNTELLDQLGLRADADGCFGTDKHQRLGLAGLYAAGDVVAALDQVGVALGHAATAATAIHNDLREREQRTPRE